VDYLRFLAERANLIEPSPIRTVISRISEFTDKGRKVIPLAAGDPDPNIIPKELLLEMMQEVLDDPRSVVYAPTQGLPDARRAIAQFCGKQYNLGVSAEDIIITTGGQQAIDLVSKVLFDPNDIILLENPSYTNTILCWKHYAVKMIAVEMDNNGMKIDLLEGILKRLRSEGKHAKLVYTITPGQNPTGVTLQEERCKHLLELASTYDFLVFEDAAYLSLQYQDRAKSLASMDKEGRVMHGNTASKIMGTGWRIGWLMAKDIILEKVLQSKMPLDMCTPSPSQLLLKQMITKNHIYGAVNTACEVYKRKKDLMLKSMEEHLPDMKFTRPVAGMSLMLWMPTEVDAWDFSGKLLEKYGVAVVPGGPFFLNGNGTNSIRLNFSRPNLDDIPTAIESISTLVKEEDIKGTYSLQKNLAFQQCIHDT
jgi:2-aminoadipate transaminase